MRLKGITHRTGELIDQNTAASKVVQLYTGVFPPSRRPVALWRPSVLVLLCLPIPKASPLYRKSEVANFNFHP